MPLLKKSWDSKFLKSKASFGSNSSASKRRVLANSDTQAHIEEETPKEHILSSFPMLLQGIAYIADASAESVHIAVRSLALTNSTRRALWLKTWPDLRDCASKAKLCGVAEA